MAITGRPNRLTLLRSLHDRLQLSRFYNIWPIGFKDIFLRTSADRWQIVFNCYVLRSSSDRFQRSFFRNVGQSFLTIPFIDPCPITNTDLELRSLNSRFQRPLLDHRWPILFGGPLYDRWTIVFWPLFTIVERSIVNIILYQNFPTCFTDLFYDRWSINFNDAFLRSLVDRLDDSCLRSLAVCC